MQNSPFLEIAQSDWILSNELAFAVLDGFPVNPGHALVITKRLVATWFEASPAEQAAVMVLVNEVKQYLDQTLQPKPTGYNVGFNSGFSAGQTVMHLHVHVIPRYDGDMVIHGVACGMSFQKKATTFPLQNIEHLRLDPELVACD